MAHVMSLSSVRWWEPMEPDEIPEFAELISQINERIQDAAQPALEQTIASVQKIIRDALEPRIAAMIEPLQQAIATSVAGSVRRVAEQGRSVYLSGTATTTTSASGRLTVVRPAAAVAPASTPVTSTASIVLLVMLAYVYAALLTMLAERASPADRILLERAADTLHEVLLIVVAAIVGRRVLR